MKTRGSVNQRKKSDSNNDSAKNNDEFYCKHMVQNDAIALDSRR